MTWSSSSFRTMVRVGKSGSLRAHRPASFIAHVPEHARPVCVGRSRPLVHPEPIHLHHRGVWRGHAEEHAIGMFFDLKGQIGFQSEPIPEPLWHDDPTRPIKFHIHGVDHARCQRSRQ